MYLQTCFIVFSQIFRLTGGTLERFDAYTICIFLRKKHFYSLKPYILRIVMFPNIFYASYFIPHLTFRSCNQRVHDCTLNNYIRCSPLKSWLMKTKCFICRCSFRIPWKWTEWQKSSFVKTFYIKRCAFSLDVYI